MNDLSEFLKEAHWRDLFSEQEWLELNQLSQMQELDINKQADYWSHLLISWDTRSLVPQRQVYQEARTILNYYLQYLADEKLWPCYELERLRLRLAETQIELQQKQLLFWRFEFEQKQERVHSLHSEIERAQAEFYNLSELTQFVSKDLKDETDLIHDALDGLMGVLDATWTALFMQNQAQQTQGTLFTLHDGRFMIYPDYHFPVTGFWQGFWQSEQAQLHDFWGPVSELEPLFPHTRSLLTQTLSSPNQTQGLLIACSNEVRAFSGFRQLFNIFGTHIASSLQNAHLHAQLNELAIRDALTGVYNRHHLEDRMNYSFELSRRYNRELSVLMVDIDHFKTINDTYGHQVGDMVLRDVAHIIQQRLRSTDIVGRYGGEEFMAILQETGGPGTEIVAEDLVKKIADKPFDVGFNQHIQVTISVGYALYPGDAQSIEDLIRVADLGLYQAKRLGRNQVAYTGQFKSMLQ